MFARIFDIVLNVSFRRSRYHQKACAALSLKVLDLREPRLSLGDMVPRTEATRVFLARRRAIFRSRFRLDRGKSWRSESSTSCLNMSSFLRTRACGSTRCESGRLCVQAQHLRREKCEIFSIVLFHRFVFVHAVDVAPDVGFQRS